MAQKAKIYMFSEFEKYDLITLSELKRLASDMTKKIKEYNEDSIVEITVVDVKQRMKSLQTQFNEKKRRIETEEPGTGASMDKEGKYRFNINLVELSRLS